jgi:phage terminase large subunit-like protein
MQPTTPNALDGIWQVTPEQLAALPARDYAELETILDLEIKQFEQSKLYRLFPDTGPLRRELYPKHLDFFAAGAKHQERAFIAGNRTGKTFAGCYELTCHLIGWYPHWWQGRRFTRPITAWAAGEDTKAIRESLQETLLGRVGAFGTGLIPGDVIANTTARGGVPEAVDAVTVRSGAGLSRLLFKSYDQGRESFEAAKVDVMMFDEEPPMAIYTEGLTRTMSTVPGEPSGVVLATFTPLRGLSGVVLSFMPGGERIEGALA